MPLRTILQANQMKPFLIYLCGPITGIPNGNRYAFDKAERYYTNRGHHVINPHSYADSMPDVPEYKIIREELAGIVCNVDMLALLPGWQNSRFGLIEVAVALATGIHIINAFTFDPIYPTIKIRTNGTNGSKELVSQHRKSTQGSHSTLAGQNKCSALCENHR